MTEHSAGVFVFFFLAEYASIILMCILISIVFLGGYEIFSIIYFIEKLFINILFLFSSTVNAITGSNFIIPETLIGNVFMNLASNNIIFSLINSMVLAFKSFFLVFVFI
jgi:NADH-ubiquinone oxidoreductase chain 1